MKDSLQIVGFGIITEKLAMAEIGYFANLMQTCYNRGDVSGAIVAMKAMKPFVDALLARGYKIDQILPVIK